MRLAQPAEDFWGSTPARVTRFFDQHAARERAEDARVGVLASVIANVNRPKGARALQPSDFFPSLKVAEPRRMTDAELRRAFLRRFRPAANRREGSAGG